MRTGALSAEVVADSERRRKKRNREGKSRGPLRRAGRLSELGPTEGQGAARHGHAALPSGPWGARPARRREGHLTQQTGGHWRHQRGQLSGEESRIHPRAEQLPKQHRRQILRTFRSAWDGETGKRALARGRLREEDGAPGQGTQSSLWKGNEEGSMGERLGRKHRPGAKNTGVSGKRAGPPPPSVPAVGKEEGAAGDRRQVEARAQQRGRSEAQAEVAAFRPHLGVRGRENPEARRACAGSSRRVGERPRDGRKHRGAVPGSRRGPRGAGLRGAGLRD